MKPMSHLPSKFLAYGVAALFLASLSIAPIARAGDEVLVHSEGRLSYASGGVGSESLDQLSAIARDFNLKLVFAQASGAYLSDVQVHVADAKGKALLDATADGPWFLAKLPAGSYQIAATHAGKEQKRLITLSATTPTTIDFRWTAP